MIQNFEFLNQKTVGETLKYEIELEKYLVLDIYVCAAAVSLVV